MKDGFIRVAASTVEVRAADCENNAENIINEIKKAHEAGASLIVFPELSVSGYTCGDLFLQETLIKASAHALFKILEETKNLDIISIVGAPVRANHKLYNCAAVLYKGGILGFVPKLNIPNYTEFYELRHFSKGTKCQVIDYYGKEALLGYDIIFACENMPNFKFGVEICEDSWVSAPPSCDLAKRGATVIANLSASDELIGKARYRRDLAKIHSSKTVSAFIYSSAGSGESTTDLVFSGHNLICENGLLLAESKPFEETTIYADIDLDKISFERARLNTFDIEENDYNEVYFTLPVKELNLIRKFSPLPFVPQNRENLTERCEEILSIQSTGLVTRLKHTNIKKAVLGISGGLDSTLALAVTVRAFDKLGLPRKNIIAVTMPAFGTTQRTKSNAKEIIGSYGCTYLEIDISETVKKHLKDINHDENTHDITYENAQARERTQVLMDIANKYNALVIGTGDLSELALGWATYNGDHMSMYGVNCSIPKTLVRHLVSYEAQRAQGNLKKALLDILDTPVSPELLPPKDGEISQKTEEVVGPYELHDFFLYYFIRFGYPPKKIYRIAKTAFSGAYDDETIKKWLKVFFTRFFQNQFKRSCLPDGPKVGTVSLSPRGDFRMPSDASCCAFLKEIEEL